MSFSIEFYARTKGAARSRVIAESNMPKPVREILLLAIDNIGVDDGPVIHVKANGHIAEGNGSYDRSNVAIEVAPILLVG